MPRIHNKPELRDKRKELRNNSTSAEACLWLRLKKSQLQGRKFRRQHSIGNYIVDFYCPSEKIAVELDGAHHFTSTGMQNDVERDAYLAALEITVIRFENKLVFENPEGLLEEIARHFKSQSI